MYQNWASAYQLPNGKDASWIGRKTGPAAFSVGLQCGVHATPQEE